jgi:molybdate transport system substrate-binding protein
MRRYRAVVGCVALLFTLGSAPARHSSVTVFAAASLSGAFDQLADTLRLRQPGLSIAINYAGSQSLALQIQQGARADVFASADDRWMAVIRDSGLSAGEPRIFAHNRLVLIVPAANPARISRWQDLARHGVKLVLADAAVPAGRYAREIFVRSGAMTGFPPGYADSVRRNVVSNEDNVKGVVAKVELGEADAGVVYASDVTPAIAPAVRAIDAPAGAGVIAGYPIVVLRQSENPSAARAFVDLVLSPAGQAVLQGQGFLPAGTVR